MDLDEFRNNYPVYDVSSHSEVASVKTHWNLDGNLNKHAIAAYMRDFRTMLGFGRAPNALKNDGKNILKARDGGVPVPKELRGLDTNAAEDVEKAGEYLKNHGRLRIPHDHYERIREALDQEINRFPENYGSPAKEQVRHLLDRVQSIGVSSSDLEEMIIARQRKR